MNRMEQTKALRARTDIHYNCCQSVLVPFCRECGLTEEEAYKLGAHFGGGMKHGGTCGAVTGALMVLGMAGQGNEAALELLSRFRNKNQVLECAKLLALAKDRGEDRKSHCDRMVYDAVELLEDLLAENQ
ncbi:C-GCAxxG-C-C family protein [Intestinimonas massiliensis (ex Afouda et al. 2020)]|uniref:C-GCAxxG-C-C family protein n=1 Tax=Intestinimonas massiliensis (ex Afouda et al. 2020) TaxID=1673721 RepID=UPI0010303874|nr:C-GCAxxG-C-C family protein [Intestinimonas massiliensis (ex Afouda et al. 2020)]